VEYEIEKTESFDKWLKKLRDRKAVLAITARLDRAKLDNFGDVEPVGDGVSEMRIFLSPGYRLYFTIRDNKIIFMLCGGDKSTQKKDIKKAQEIAQTI
jgi:putative addiction module killer protein